MIATARYSENHKTKVPDTFFTLFFSVMILFIGSLVTGCDDDTVLLPVGVGHADYEVDFGGMYRLYRSSANRITLQKDDRKGVVVSAKVVHLYYDDKIFLVERHPWHSVHTKPDSTKKEFWLIVRSPIKIEGPYTEKQLITKAKERGIATPIKWITPKQARDSVKAEKKKRRSQL